MEENGDAQSSTGDYLGWIRDIEDKQRVLKNRVLLIGQNLIDMKEDFQMYLLSWKMDLTISILQSTYQAGR